MLLTEPFFELGQRSHVASVHIGQAAIDAFEGLEFIDLVEELLVGGGVLHDEFRFSVDREHQRMAGLTHPGKKLTGMALEIAEGMDVLADVEMGHRALVR